MASHGLSPPPPSSSAGRWWPGHPQQKAQPLGSRVTRMAAALHPSPACRGKLLPSPAREQLGCSDWAEMRHLLVAVGQLPLKAEAWLVPEVGPGVSPEGPAALAGPWAQAACRSGRLRALSLSCECAVARCPGPPEHGPGEGVRHSGARRSPPQRQVREPRGQLLQRPPRKGPSRAPHRAPGLGQGSQLASASSVLLLSLTHSQAGGLWASPMAPGAQAASLPTILPQP